MVDKIKLTDRAIKALKPAPVGKRTVTWDALQPHLCIRVTETGAKTFIVRKRMSGVRNPVEQVLGAYPSVTLEAARKLARTSVDLIVAGVKPVERQKQKTEEARRRSADTFEAVAGDFIAKHASKNRSGREAERVINTYLLPRFGHRQIGEIKRREIAGLLNDMENREFKDKSGRNLGGPVMADHVLAQLRKLMNWHAARDDDFISPIVRGMARTKPKERAGDRILTDNELRAIWAALDAKTVDASQERHDATDLFAAFVRTLLLTAQRREEVAGMMRSEIGTDGIWTIPAERHKTGTTGKVKVVPPTKAVRAILENLDQVDESELIFTTNGATPFSGFSKSKSRLDANMLAKLRDIAAARNDKVMLANLIEVSKLLEAARKGNKEARQNLMRAWWRLHDLRRTAKTLMMRAGVRPDISERVLGHVIGGVEGVYDRYEYLVEKRDALSKLAEIVPEIVTQKPDGNILRLRRA
jgi:hypothetical protein